MQGAIDNNIGHRHHPGSVRTSVGLETTGTDLGVCAPWRGLRPQAITRESATRRDLRPQAPGRVRIKEGPPPTPIAWRRVEAMNTRILLEGKTHQQSKHQQIRTEKGEGGSGSHTNSTQDIYGNTTKY